MRKIICALFLLLCACGDKPRIQGQEFQTTQNGLEITLGFGAHDNRYYGKAINSYYGTYHLQGDTLTFSPVSATMYGTDAEELAQEDTYFDLLAHIKTFRLTSDSLILISTDKRQILFKKHH